MFNLEGIETTPRRPEISRKKNKEERGHGKNAAFHII